ncbi:MAG: N-acetylmuramoyl-L-alanine amidase [Nocardioidaceae bacterium]
MAVPAQASSARAATGREPVVAALSDTATKEFRMVAVTWAHAAPITGLVVDVRARVNGAWTSWQHLDSDPNEGPATGQETVVRDGTAPLWVGQADGVAVRMTSPSGQAPGDIKIVTINPGSDASVAASAASARGATTSTSVTSVTSSTPASGAPITRAPRFPAMPQIITRAQWGADPKLGNQCWAPRYGSAAKMVFIHHTAGSNSYSAADSPAIVRSIYAYHTQSRGWCDIAYNFLVDKYGNIFEGRRGGMTKPVRGAHAGNYNTDSVGISLMGNFDTAHVTARMANATVRLVGWRLGTSYMPVTGKVFIYDKRFNRISGHRDAMQTDCPGTYAYAWLPTLRKRVTGYLARFHSPIAAKWSSIGGIRTTGQVFIGEAHFANGMRTVMHRGLMFWKAGDGAHYIPSSLLTVYRAYGGAPGVLGFPTADIRAAAASGWTKQLFEHGRTYLRTTARRTTTFTFYGPILWEYRHERYAGGKLGLPRSGVRNTTNGQRATFEHGVVTWDKSTNKITITYS